MRLMRVPLAGGTPQLVLADTGINNFQCARSPSTFCVFSQYTADHVAFFSFDPVTGKKEPLTRIEEPEWHLQNWTLSPDGSTLALAKKHLIPGLADIRLFRSPAGRTGFLRCRRGRASRVLTGLPMAAVCGLSLRRQPECRRS
jgi:hypothetical protein